MDILLSGRMQANLALPSFEALTGPLRASCLDLGFQHDITETLWHMEDAGGVSHTLMGGTQRATSNLGERMSHVFFSEIGSHKCMAKSEQLVRSLFGKNTVWERSCEYETKVGFLCDAGQILDKNAV